MDRPGAQPCQRGAFDICTVLRALADQDHPVLERWAGMADAESALPESMRKLQLAYGAEIGRAIVNFRGPIVFCVISRYHDGAFVVFSKTLNPDLTVLAVDGSYASVLGGAPAAAEFDRVYSIRRAQQVGRAGYRC